ncbi:MAG TPA: hypothetical protein VKU60_01580 [Chloroflexota bacterium]|nr:hypothetical protein [Chloroflexota bacterium]
MPGDQAAAESDLDFETREPEADEEAALEERLEQLRQGGGALPGPAWGTSDTKALEEEMLSAWVAGARGPAPVEPAAPPSDEPAAKPKAARRKRAAGKGAAGKAKIRPAKKPKQSLAGGKTVVDRPRGGSGSGAAVVAESAAVSGLAAELEDASERPQAGSLEAPEIEAMGAEEAALQPVEQPVSGTPRAARLIVMSRRFLEWQLELLPGRLKKGRFLAVGLLRLGARGTGIAGRLLWRAAGALGRGLAWGGRLLVRAPIALLKLPLRLIAGLDLAGVLGLVLVVTALAIVVGLRPR